jgi:hypothetical protein
MTAHSNERLNALRRSLGRELFQTEQSAASHCRREAARLPGTQPAGALMAISEHADRTLVELPALAVSHDMPVSGAARRVGRLFSITRQLVGDRLLRRERSYRGTLLGMRHGLDVVHMLRHLAEHAGDRALVSWCDAWLAVRCPLVQRAEEELRWFAEHPELAMQIAVPLGQKPGESMRQASP